MATNLAIDPELLREALEVSGLKTKKDTVNLALKEFKPDLLWHGNTTMSVSATVRDAYALGLGAGHKVPKWDEASNSFQPAVEANLTLSFDHRVLDGGATSLSTLQVAAIHE